MVGETAIEPALDKAFAGTVARQALAASVLPRLSHSPRDEPCRRYPVRAGRPQTYPVIRDLLSDSSMDGSFCLFRCPRGRGASPAGPLLTR